MTTLVKLLSASLRYPPDLVLHTAVSGPVTALDELYLVVERNGEIEAFGEIRENVAYLAGLEPSTVRAGVIRLASALDWSEDPAAIYDRFLNVKAAAPALSRALVDATLVDWVARRRNIPVSELFEAPFLQSQPTNQSLFISEDRQLLVMAQRYVERGFRSLKVRVGQKDFAADRRRIAMLRERFGEEVEIAIDANGSWALNEAIGHLDALSRYAVAYAEQPIAAGDWNAARELAARSPIPIMLDESMATAEDVTRVINAGGRLWAHLKISKLGGITPAVESGRRLAAAGVPFMVGQMNEGAGATAAAYHCALATSAAYAELYGADGLLEDPVKGVSYADGRIGIQRAPGLGVSIDPTKLNLICEMRA